MNAIGILRDKQYSRWMLIQCIVILFTESYPFKTTSVDIIRKVFALSLQPYTFEKIFLILIKR